MDGWMDCCISEPQQQRQLVLSPSPGLFTLSKIGRKCNSAIASVIPSTPDRKQLEHISVLYNLTQLPCNYMRLPKAVFSCKLSSYCLSILHRNYQAVIELFKFACCRINEYLMNTQFVWLSQTESRGTLACLCRYTCLN